MHARLCMTRLMHDRTPRARELYVRTYVRVYLIYTNAGLETYPYSPRLVRVNITLNIRAW